MVNKTTKDTFEIKGEQLLNKIKELIKEGNVRKITIKNKQGQTLIVLPLTLGVVGAALAPVLAAISTMAVLLSECTIAVERYKKPAAKKTLKTTK